MVIKTFKGCNHQMETGIYCACLKAYCDKCSSEHMAKCEALRKSLELLDEEQKARKAEQEANEFKEGVKALWEATGKI